jgi:hypothetical protein
MRERKVHALKGNGQKLFAGLAYCEDSRASEFTMQPWHPVGREVTCRRCLYYIGFYVPLVKLKEHQAMQRLAGNPCNLHPAYVL